VEIADSWIRAAREAAASAPLPSSESVRELKRRLHAHALRRALEDPEAVRRIKSEREVRVEMRRTCERYLAEEIPLQTLTRRLRNLEQRLSDA
jgi:hypothetical protein